MVSLTLMEHLEDYYGSVGVDGFIQLVQDHIKLHIREQRRNEPKSNPDKLILDIKQKIINYSIQLNLPLVDDIESILYSIEYMLNTEDGIVLTILPYLLSSYIMTFSSNKIIKKYIDPGECDQDSAFCELFINKGNLKTGMSTNYNKNLESLSSHFFIKGDDIKKHGKDINWLEVKDLSRIFCLCLYICREIPGVNLSFSTWMYHESLLGLKMFELDDPYRKELIVLARYGVTPKIAITSMKFNKRTDNLKNNEETYDSSWKDLSLSEWEDCSVNTESSDQFGETTAENDKALSSAAELINPSRSRYISISNTHQITIPDIFFEKLNFNSEAECSIRYKELIVKPVEENTDSEFTE